MSLRLRLLLTLAPLFIIGLAAADAGTYAAVQNTLLQGVDQQLVSIQPGVTNVLDQHSCGAQGPGRVRVRSGRCDPRRHVRGAHRCGPSKVLVVGYLFGWQAFHVDIASGVPEQHREANR